MRFTSRFYVIAFSLALACSSTSVLASPGKPILVSSPASTRAVALEAVTFTSEPFTSQTSSYIYGSDRATRIVLFALNLSPTDNNVAMMSATAEDASHHLYDLRVEYVGRVEEEPWLSIVVIRLDDTMGDLGDVLLQVKYAGVAGNRVRVGIGHIGGGPPDDPGATPTPAPPYILKGQVTSGGAPLAGVNIKLTPSTLSDAITDSNGKYSFLVPAVSDFTIIPTMKYFTFSPVSVLLANLANSQTIDFIGVRDTFAVTGLVRDANGVALDGISVKRERSGAATATAFTANGGKFSFSGVPAGYAYTTTPQNSNLWAFTSQTINELDRDTDLSFSGTLRNYTILGFISDKVQHGVSGVTVTLSGAASAVTTTDANGNYSFSNLPAGLNYSITAAKTDHDVSPGSQTFNLLHDERADFSAIRYYIISGRVTDAARGLYGITMTLAGPENFTARTSIDGSYSFKLTTAGGYVLTPSREQNFYQFSPASQMLNVTDHQTVNFNGTLSIAGPTYVLEFDGTPMSVDYKFFWPANLDIGHFFWEFWAMPGTNTYTRYLISDGYGGAHAILFGFNYGPTGHYNLFGNIWNGAPNFYFFSDDGPAPGEWGHYAVGWDGQNVITYYDGVPVGKQPFTGPRSSTNLNNGSNLLLIGGSDHQNVIGRIAQVRGYEEHNPRESAPESAFRPETVFSVDGQFLSYYFHPSTAVADLSYDGYRGVQHNGHPRGMLGGYFAGCEGCPEPRFVIDPSAPNFANSANPGTATTLIDTPAPVPNGARLFDSLSRNNSTYILNGQGGLGQTETGAQTWRTNINVSQPQPFGILSGRAVVLVNETAVAWIDGPGSDVDVRVSRAPGQGGSGTNTGLCFRVLDKNNFFFAYSHDDQANPSGAKRLAVGYFQAGIRTMIADDIVLSASWNVLRVVTKSDGTISVYADATPVYATNNSLNAASTGEGIFNYGPALGLENRWDNFTILDAP